MTPRHSARLAWEADCTESFDRAEMYCLLHGVVVSTPVCYVMGMFLPLDTPDDYLTDLTRQHRRMTLTNDLCHVWCAAGNIRELISLLHNHPTITHLSFQKRGYDIHRLPLNRIKHHGKRT